MFPAGNNVKVDARRPGHGVVEGAGDGPLADAVLADEAEDEGGEDAVGGAEDEAAVGGEEAGVEGGGGDGEVGEGEEGAGEAEVEGEEAEADEEDGVHGFLGGCGAIDFLASGGGFSWCFVGIGFLFVESVRESRTRRRRRILGI